MALKKSMSPSSAAATNKVSAMAKSPMSNLCNFHNFQQAGTSSKVIVSNLYEHNTHSGRRHKLLQLQQVDLGTFAKDEGES